MNIWKRCECISGGRARETHIEGVVEIEIVVAVEVSADEVVNFRLGGRVQILELVHRLELDDVEAVWQDAIGLALEQVLGLVRGDVRDSGEDVSTMSGATLDAVAVVDAALASFVVDIKILEIVVKIDAARAEVAAKECGVCGEDGGDIDVAFAAKGDREACLPFVEVGDDGGGQLARDVLWAERIARRDKRDKMGQR